MVEEFGKAESGLCWDTDRRFRKFIETTQVIPWEADARTWGFSYVDPQAVDLLGYPLKRWFEKDFGVQAIHPQDLTRVAEFCVRSFKVSSDFNFEYRIIVADGAVHWIDVRVPLEK